MRVQSHSRANEESSSFELRLLQQLDELTVVYIRSRSSESRFALRNYLKAVLALYLAWTSDDADRVAARAAKLKGRRRRDDSHPLRIIIDLTSGETDLKTRSRWARALEYGINEGVSPARFKSFVRANGGISACAAKAAQTLRRRKDRPKRQWFEDDDLDEGTAYR
jgi:hypothetical protein